MFLSSSRKKRLNPLEEGSLENNYKVFSLLAISFAFVLTLLYGFSVAEPSRKLAALMATFLAAAAPFVVGGFVGFLFGIPRTLQDNQAAGPAPPVITPMQDPRLVPGKPGGEADARSLHANARHDAEMQHAWQANSNLEQISDWLTKIIVGIGLTQLTRLPAAVESIGDYIATAISPHAPGAIGSLILIVFSVTGFVTGYLVTMSDLAREIDLQEMRRHQIIDAQHHGSDWPTRELFATQVPGHADGYMIDATELRDEQVTKLKEIDADLAARLDVLDAKQHGGHPAAAASSAPASGGRHRGGGRRGGMRRGGAGGGSGSAVARPAAGSADTAADVNRKTEERADDVREALERAFAVLDPAQQPIAKRVLSDYGVEVGAGDPRPGTPGRARQRQRQQLSAPARRVSLVA